MWFYYVLYCNLPKVKRSILSLFVLFIFIHYRVPRTSDITRSIFLFSCYFEYFCIEKKIHSSLDWQKKNDFFSLWKAKISYSSGVNKPILQNELNNDHLVIIYYYYYYYLLCIGSLLSVFFLSIFFSSWFPSVWLKKKKIGFNFLPTKRFQSKIFIF